MCIFFVSCKNHWYRVSNKRNHIIQTNYNKNDTILLNDYIICNNLRGVWGNESIPINQDSVLNIFVSALEKLSLQFMISEGHGICDTSFFANPYLKFKKMDHKRILELAKRDESNIVLVPIIYLDNTFLKNIYYTSTGIPDGGGFNKSTALRIGIFLFEGNNIIYFKSMHYFSDGIKVSDKKSPVRNLDQEHWDRLVRLVMNDYIKRLE